MSGRLRTSVLGAVVGSAVLLGGPAGVIGPALADPVASCTSSRGVLVVVDFRPFGGSLERGCDATITNGYDALHDAGFTSAGTVHDGPAFICRIDDRPGPAREACVQTPPGNAYWSYWHADRGRTAWTYSSKGVAGYHPPAGSVDAWVFGAGTQPAFTPAQARAATAPRVPTTPTPRTATPRTATPRTPTPRDSTTAAAQPSGPARPRTSTAARPAAGTSTAAVSAGRGPTSPARPATSGAASVPPPSSAQSAQSDTAAPSFVDAPPAAAGGGGSAGSAGPLIAALVLVTVLGGLAGWTVLRRRRAAAADR